jgi:hypothetical protein
LEDKDDENTFANNNKDQKEVVFTYRHLKFLGVLFWLLTIPLAFLSISYYMFTSFVTDFLMNRFKYEYLDAKNLVALMPIATIVSIPIFSGIALVWGQKAFCLLLASFMATFIF